MRRSIYLLFALSVSLVVLSQTENLYELLNRKQYNRIVFLSDQLQVADSSDFQTMFIIGQAYEGLMKYHDAYRFYQHCLSIDSTQIELLNATARMAANLGKIDDAETYYLKVWASDTTDFYANIQLARFYSQIGNDEKAIDYYEYLLDFDPDNPGLLRTVGDCYYRLDEKYAAAEAYWFAFQNNKGNAGLALTLINTVLPFKNENNGLLPSLTDNGLPIRDGHEIALEVCDTALIYNPGNKRLIQSKGTALFMAKRYQEADSIFMWLLAQGDSSYYNIKYGGCSKYYLGRNMEAADLLDIVFKEDSTAVDVCLLLGHALGRSYDRRRALQLFDRVEVLMQPAQAYVDLLVQFRADVYIFEGRLAEAYQLWLTYKRRDILSNMYNRIGNITLSRTEDEDMRARCMFINVLVATERANYPANERILTYVRAQLERFKEEMFFRSMKEYPMIAPNNTKSTITAERLEALIQQLPKGEM